MLPLELIIPVAQLTRAVGYYNSELFLFFFSLALLSPSEFSCFTNSTPPELFMSNVTFMTFIPFHLHVIQGQKHGVSGNHRCWLKADGGVFYTVSETSEPEVRYGMVYFHPGNSESSPICPRNIWYMFIIIIMASYNIFSIIHFKWGWHSKSLHGNELFSIVSIQYNTICLELTSKFTVNYVLVLIFNILVTMFCFSTHIQYIGTYVLF